MTIEWKEEDLVTLEALIASVPIPYNGPSSPETKYKWWTFFRKLRADLKAQQKTTSCIELTEVDLWTLERLIASVPIPYDAPSLHETKYKWWTFLRELKADLKDQQKEYDALHKANLLDEIKEMFAQQGLNA